MTEMRYHSTNGSIYRLELSVLAIVACLMRTSRMNERVSEQSVLHLTHISRMHNQFKLHLMTRMSTEVREKERVCDAFKMVLHFPFLSRSLSFFNVCTIRLLDQTGRLRLKLAKAHLSQFIVFGLVCEGKSLTPPKCYVYVVTRIFSNINYNIRKKKKMNEKTSN